MQSLTRKLVVYGLITLLGLLSALPNVLPTKVLQQLPAWYTQNQITLGLDLRGGAHLLLAVDTASQLPEETLDDLVERTLEVLRRRLDETGLVEPSITRQGRDQILIQLPGVEDPSYIRQLLGTTAQMNFHWAADQRQGQTLRVAGQGGEEYLLEQRVALEGRHIRDARLAYHPESGEPVVNFKLDSEGARLFGELTRQNVGRVLAVVLDDRVITAPVIRSPILGGSGEISGQFSAAEARDLALLLRAGALPAPLEVLEERTVGPDLGSDAIAMGLSTGLLGAALVLGFMLLLYGSWGLIACLGLSLNIGLMFGLLSALGATLTLPGIAGIILSIGMAVDANILINERIREESEQGVSARAAVAAGFDRAFATILDASVTTLIAVGLLFLFGTGPIRGFAVTIAIGLLVSLFTAMGITRVLMEWRVRKQGRQTLRIAGHKLYQRLRQRPLAFMRARFLGLVVSGVLSLASLVLLVQPGLHKGIDFAGGSILEAHTQVNLEQLRGALSTANLGSVAIQEFGSEGHFLVRLPQQSADQLASGAPVEAVKQALLALDASAEFPRVESVGARVSGDFADTSILALLLAGTGMLGYLWLRFEGHFAGAAILTLALDLTKTLGFFALFGIEFNLTAIAALLALIGYSVNDKVVVFDRIRERLRQNPQQPLAELLNDSLNATLTRTLFTSLTTLLALLPMAIAGGQAVASFALPMLFAIVVGTSSSIFIAAPIMLLLGERRQRLGIPQLRPPVAIEGEGA